MKILSLTFVLSLGLSFSLQAQEGCKHISCPNDSRKIETQFGYSCKKRGTNIDHGPVCHDRGFESMSGAEGRKIIIREFKDGDRHGKVTHWLGNVKIDEQEYKNNYPNGKRIVRHPRTGQTLEESHYIDGKLHGKYFKFDKDSGMKIDESDFVDGKMVKETLFERKPDGTLKMKIIKEGIGGHKITEELYSDKGDLIVRKHSEDGELLWEEKHDKEGWIKRENKELLKKIGNCHIEKKGELFELKIGSKVFAQSKLQIPLIRAIKEAKKACEKFEDSQNINGCKVSKTIESPRPNAEMEVNGQFKSVGSGMMAMQLHEAITGAYHLSKAGLCDKMSENQCRASFHEPHDKSKQDAEYNIHISQSGKKYHLKPESTGEMYYISRILFGSKCVKEYVRGSHCSIRSIPSKDDYGRDKYELSLGGETVAKGEFYDMDDLLIGWDAKFCQDGKVNKCQLKKVEHSDGRVSYGVYLDGRLACKGKHCESSKMKPGRDDDDIAREKHKFQDQLYNKIPKFAMKHGCFYPEGFADKFLNGIADDFVKTDREEAINELERRIASENEEPGNSYRGPDFLAPRDSASSTQQ